jgi:hypothetical protein
VIESKVGRPKSIVGLEVIFVAFNGIVGVEESKGVVLSLDTHLCPITVVNGLLLRRHITEYSL